MTHSSRFNYKAKLSRKENAETATDKAIDAFYVSQQVIERNLRHATDLQEQVIRLGDLTKHCLQFLDEKTAVGETKCELVTTDADDKLSDLPLTFIVKRANQVVSLMGQRLEIALDELDKFDRLVGSLLTSVQNTAPTHAKFEKALVSHHIIGRQPTSPEVEDAHKALGQGSQYRRYGVSFDDSEQEEEEEEYANGH